MAGKNGRPPVMRQRILAILLAHHRVAGWATPIARGELLARLYGWQYGSQELQRAHVSTVPVPVFQNGIDPGVNAHAYQTAQVYLTQTLQVMFGRGLVLLGVAWGETIHSAAETQRDLEQKLEKDLADPLPAYQQRRPQEHHLTLEQYLAKRRAAVAAWQAGRGRAPFKVQRVALSEAGRQLAESQEAHFPKSVEPLATYGKSTEAVSADDQESFPKSEEPLSTYEKSPEAAAAEDQESFPKSV